MNSLCFFLYSWLYEVTYTQVGQSEKSGLCDGWWKVHEKRNIKKWICWSFQYILLIILQFYDFTIHRLTVSTQLKLYSSWLLCSFIFIDCSQLFHASELLLFLLCCDFYFTFFFHKWVSAAVQCSYCARTTYMETAALFLYYSLSSFSAFSFCVFVILTVLFLFLGASIVCVNNPRRTADCLVIPRQDICSCTILWFIEDFRALF